MKELKMAEKPFIYYSDFLELKKIVDNRPSGNESEEERKKYGYTPQEVDKEKRYFIQLKNEIKKDINKGKFINSKVFIIGVINGKPTYYLVDGQHTGGVYVELIDEGILDKDTKFFYELRKYDSYNDMINDLHVLNNGNKWSKIDHARGNGLETEGREIYMRMANEYYGILPDGVIRQCIFGQNNGNNIFAKKYTVYYKELLHLTVKMKELCQEKGLLTPKQINRMCGVAHSATTFRDLLRVVIRENAKSFSKTEKEKSTKTSIDLCLVVIKALLGDYSKVSTGWTPLSAATLLNINSQKEFKKAFVEQMGRDAIKFCSRTTEKNKDTVEFLKNCVDIWANKE